MQPGIYNFNVPQGSDYSLSFTIAGYNLTTYTAKMQVRTEYGSPIAMLTLTNGSGITLGNGTFVVNITNAQSNTLLLGTWVYDLEIVSAGGLITRLIQGRFTVTPQVTV